jgi:DNA-binding transcriptional MerR regulator
MTAQWLRVGDAAQITGLRPALIRRWAARDVIESERRGRLIYVHLADVRRAELDLRLYGPRPGRPRVAR